MSYHGIDRGLSVSRNESQSELLRTEDQVYEKEDKLSSEYHET
jgi:hypothetical protein